MKEKIKNFLRSNKVKTISGKVYRISTIASLSVILFMYVPTVAILASQLMKNISDRNKLMLMLAMVLAVMFVGAIIVVLINQILFGIQIKPFNTLFGKITDHSEKSLDLDMSANRDFAKLMENDDEIGDVARLYYNSRKQKEDMFNTLVKTNAELKEANVKANEAVKEAERVNAANSAFLARMSHELRTPMNAIIGMSEMLLRLRLDERGKQYTSVIKTSGEDLLSIVNDIIDFSKIEAGEMELNPTEFDMLPLLDDEITIALMRLKENNLEFKWGIDESVPRRLWGDELRIRQVLNGLLSNAVKYTESGFIALSVSGNFEEDMYYIRISIMNSGECIFDNGIDITGPLLDLIGATVDVNSTEAGRSEFGFTLPLKVVDETPIGDFDKERKSLKDKVTAFTAGFKSPESRVLVVDDNEVNLQVADGLLDEFKVMTELVNSGNKCLDMIKDDPYFDIIFMDHMMPGMDGIECLNAIRSMDGEFYKTVPVVALTANAVAGMEQKFMEAGFDGFLAKPIKMQELENILLQFLPKDQILANDSEEAKMLENVPVLSTAYTGAAPEGNAGDEIPGIDMEQGLLMIGGRKDIYVSVLGTYLREGREKIPLIREFAETNNLEQYAIYVHALKSASRNIGASVLGEHAFMHEERSKAGDGDFVRDNYEALLAEYELLLANIEHFLAKEA